MIKRGAFVAIWLVAAACSDSQLPPAQADNRIDTITLGALSKAALSIPAAYSIPTAQAIRTDLSSGFDFLYDIDATGRKLLYPLAALGLGATNGVNPGLQTSTSTFEALLSPPNDGYLTTDTLLIAPGQVWVARSRVTCYLNVPQYAKVEILDFDDEASTVRLKVLSNTNCGYRSLSTGIPAD